MTWLHCYQPRPAARLRLVCFPHAGGAATFFRGWANLVPPEIELLAVQYPGRGDRLADPPFDDMYRLVSALAESLSGRLDAPYAFFGHSMGAAVAHETVAHLLREGHPGPVRFFASGREAPHHHHGGDLHLRGDDALAGELIRLGGTPPELLADVEMRSLLLPTLRADYRLIETYRPSGAALGCPVTAMIGQADPDVPIAEAADWAAVTHGGFDLRTFTGDHFYLVPHRQAVVGTLVHHLGMAPAWPSTP